MRLQNKFLFSVFCMLLMGFIFMSTGDIAAAQDYCCNNNSPSPQDGFCVPAPQGAQNCGGANQTFFIDGVDGIELVPLGPPPTYPQSGDLCPNMAPLRGECLCLDVRGATVPCQTLLPTPTPPPTEPPPTEPPPTGTPIPTATPIPTPAPGEGCCVEEPGVCSVTVPEACPVPPNLDFLGEGVSCDGVSACNVPPPPVTEVPTMNEWGLIVTALMLGLFSLITVRRGFFKSNKS